MRKILRSPFVLFLWVILVSNATAPAIFLGDGDRNLLLIGVMSLSPVVIMVSHKFYRLEIWLFLFMLSIVSIPFLWQPESMRWSTVLYSFMFCLTFLAYSRLLHSKIFILEDYLSFLKYIIYGYTIVLLIQQFCVLTGLPIFNSSNYYLAEPWKLNSLSAEPSHSARIVALLMYCYIVAKEIITHATYDFRKNIKKDKWVWLGFLWTMLTMGSGTAFIFIMLVFLKFMRLKNIVSLILIATILIIIINALEVYAFERTFKFIAATLTFDIDTMMNADHSASVRIVPFILVSKLVDITTLNGLLGHGIDYTSTFLSSMMMGLPEGTSGGGMFQIWLEYGFISFITFVIFSFFSTFHKQDYLSIIFWFMLVFMYGINNQIVWIAIILLFTNKYFYRNSHCRRQKSVSH